MAPLAQRILNENKMMRVPVARRNAQPSSPVLREIPPVRPWLRSGPFSRNSMTFLPSQGRPSVRRWPRTARLPRTLLLLCFGVSPAWAKTDHVDRDTDQDQIPDELERATGTNPLRKDTDGDGVPDGSEDRNRDGRVDRSAQESDPRRAGLFPGSYPHIPEPMAFDLVRGLGAQRGEVEVNTLALVRTSDGQVNWAPEVEWAFASGHAVELELPLVDRHLEGIKLALQGTLPNGNWRAFTHGWQTFAEVALDDGVTEVAGLYLLGHRLAPAWSYLMMLGGKTTASEQGLAEGTALVNLSLFFDAVEWLTFGMESNTALDEHGAWSLTLLPQAHVQLSQRVRVQFAAGADLVPEGTSGIVGTRLILE